MTVIVLTFRVHTDCGCHCGSGPLSGNFRSGPDPAAFDVVFGAERQRPDGRQTGGDGGGQSVWRRHVPDQRLFDTTRSTADIADLCILMIAESMDSHCILMAVSILEFDHILPLSMTNGIGSD